MPKHNTPKPVSAGEISKHQAPGAPAQGFRPPRPSKPNVFNDNKMGKRAWDKTTKGL